MIDLNKIIIDEKIINYFSKRYKHLWQNFNWKIPNIDGFDYSGESTYDANVKLKYYFNLKFNNCKNIQEQINIAELIIKRWGGIYRIQDKTIKKFINNFNSKKTFPHKNVSSYSKLYSMIDPDNFAIYDSRVAACLNALQLNLNIKKGYVFNYVNGRNKIIGYRDKKTGFTQDDRYKESYLEYKFNWLKIKKKNNYNFYIEFLKKIQLELENIKIYDLEMILFSDAEKQCLKLI